MTGNKTGSRFARLVRRIIIKTLALIAVFAIVAGTGGVVLLRTSLPKTDGEIAVPGLQGNVTIRRDANGIPYISADTMGDAHFALGFVHAQDRLWQMEFARRIGAGRLAEVLGERALATDKFIRTLGLYAAARSSVDHLSVDTQAALEAYAAGINAFLSTRRGFLPPEFLLLQHKPEPWRPADSVVVQKLMAMQLGRNWALELLRARIKIALVERGLPASRVLDLWPPNGDDEPVTIDTATHGAGLLPALFPGRDMLVDGASNGWLIHGSRTASGKPILANDPHLKFAAPINWYLVRIRTPGHSAAGATLPGLPFIAFGHNGRMAGGITNGAADVQDLFLEKLDPADPDRYLTADGNEAFTTREETFLVRDAEPVTITVRTTRHGPVISDVHAQSAVIIGDGEALAFASPALASDDRSLDALNGMNASSTWPEFAAAARLLNAPNVNLFFASVDGDICIISPGTIPVRRSGDGRFVAPGHDGSHDWIGMIPREALPSACNPGSGVLVNANNRITDKGYPYLMSGDASPTFRAGRILDVLRSKPVHSVMDSARLQGDIHSVAAERLVPLLVTTKTQAHEAALAIELLKNWDFQMRRDRPEPLIYAAWTTALAEALITDELGEDIARDYLGGVFTSTSRFLQHVLMTEHHWCDDVTTQIVETCDAVLSESLEKALTGLRRDNGDAIESWRWGDAHKATFTHRILTQIPLIRRSADLSIPSDGGNHTVNSAKFFKAEPNPFLQGHGAGLRAIYDLSDLANSRFIIATGQSGNPLSRHYGDMLQRWRDGAYVTIPEEPNGGDKSTLVLMPQPR